MRVGIDVGGTNTDAVLMDGDAVLAEIKCATTGDVTSGIVAALRGLLDDSGVTPERIEGVMIGTTHFTNAVVEARRLLPVAIVRLGLPATEALPPLVDWPERLRDAVGDHVHLCHGGHEFDGRAIAPLDRDELRRAAEAIAVAGLRTAAISSVFSPINDELEREAGEIVRETVPDIAISRSAEIGRLGLLERENATIINASLAELAVHITTAFRAALEQMGIEAPVYLSQNDGTLMTAEYVERYPVATFASGPTNSMRGAALLSGERDCAVVDIGGTTSDVGMLVGGFPREAKASVEIGGVRTNFRMPDVVVLPVGGGTVVSGDPGAVRVGPDSLGFRLDAAALVFGGATATLTDAAVGGGRAEVGDRARLNGHRALLAGALERSDAMLAEAVDRAKMVRGEPPLIVVGGAGFLVPDDLPGVSEVRRPEHSEVANAFGAAIAQISGQVDRIVHFGTSGRDRLLASAREAAQAQAVRAGADPDRTAVVEVEEVPLAYLTDPAVRIRVKAVGPLGIVPRRDRTEG